MEKIAVTANPERQANYERQTHKPGHVNQPLPGDNATPATPKPRTAH
jgi:hypothetical protein